MTIYRLTKAKYAETAFRGSRGRGRWHEQGVPMVYAADQPATALLETLVHTGRADLVTTDYVLFEIELQEDQDLLTLSDADLPSDWREWPWPASTQEIGTFWHERRDSLALSVPSAVIPIHRNVLLNIQHPRFANLAIDGPIPFPVDTRLGVSSESNV
ncbi:RES family NAD+ phosphorylase [Longibacter salinarum]|uniref:RES family NAD+ phosphorylase n=1 Tax=Longibacter salinarum TaxID=1850348 RepID=UPI0015CF5A25|nr:RES family NAD+ phosphorylase [Longibacter salinarum]